MRLRSALIGVMLGGCVMQMQAQAVAIHGDNGVVLGPPPVVAVKPVTDLVAGHEITDDYKIAPFTVGIPMRFP